MSSTSDDSAILSSPLIRLTRAVDPSTTPVVLKKAWVLRLPSPPASSTMASVQKLLKVLQREHGANPLRQLKTIRKVDEETGSQLDVVLAYQDEAGDLSTHDGALDLIRLHAAELLAGVTIADGGQLRLVDVPTTPIPIRARTAEWNAFWPCVLRMTGPAMASSTGADAKKATSLVTSSSAAIEFVDRAQDARLWTQHPARLRWARDGFQACIREAQRARANGDLPIAAYVTTAFGHASGSGEALLPLAAHDTRTSTNHPLRHAVLNAIRSIADRRAAQRLQPAADSSSLEDQDRLSLASSSALPPSSGPPAVENGQEYLFNSLSLFTTHEPCPFCAMALVHSRVRQVFFLVPSPHSGGCCGDRRKSSASAEETSEEAVEGGKGGGSFVLHEQAGLNHHFEVWRWVGGWSSLGFGSTSEPVKFRLW